MDWLRKISQNVIARNLILAFCAIIVLATVASLLLNVFTRHNNYKEVPSYVGIKLEDVERQAKKDRLRIEVIDSIYAPIYDGGVVLEQVPAAGTEVKNGRRVFVTITSHTQKMVPVPYVTGFSLRQAKNMIEMAGLEIAELKYVGNIATNNVLAELNGRDTIRRNSNLQLEVGSGLTLVVGRAEDAKPVEVPKLIGLSLGEAKSRIWERGLNVGKITFDEDINLVNQKDSKVYRQGPSFGTRARLGDKVAITLTLEDKKVNDGSNAADRDARKLIQRREAEEAEQAE